MTKLLTAILMTLILLPSCRSSHRTRHSDIEISVMSAVHIKWTYRSCPVDTISLPSPRGMPHPRQALD